MAVVCSRIRLMARGVKVRCTSLRRRVWSGGSSPRMDGARSICLSRSGSMCSGVRSEVSKRCTEVSGSRRIWFTSS